MTPVVRECTVDVDGAPARYLESGAGWPMVLIHGFPLSADMWRPQLDAVPDGWRFIAPDLPGFRGPGSTAASRPAPAPATMDAYARYVGRLLDALDIEAGVVGGLSMGGYVVFALYRLMPERFTRMVLADTRPQADTAEARAARAAMRETIARGGPSAVADGMLPALLSADADAPLRARVRQLIEANPREAIDAAVVAMTARPDSTPDLPKIGCPALIITGEADAITPPADADAMQRAIARSTLTVLAGAGHLSNLERPADFSRTLADYLASNL
ncbi:MAG TPA: alpha/beta fold hydrolase [Vicinamibacterales bacterium]|nr:alpha/beta fold hydrolase [Vicinamibacterales bacterium]